MMDENEDKIYPRNDLADLLEKLANQLRSGSIRVGAEYHRVPDNLEVRLRLKEKKDEMSCKLEWRWSLSRESEEAIQDVRAPRRVRFKEVKKNLARSFKELKKAAERGLLPDEKILGEFLMHSRAFLDLAEPAWEQAAREYADHLENLLRTVSEGFKESVRHELNDLQNRMVACHKEFR
jgi:XXXCH domain-containing protein